MSYEFRNIYKGITLKGQASNPLDAIEGSIFHNSTDKVVRAYLDSAVRTLVTDTQVQILTNKELTLPKINEAVDLTATSTELNQLDGVTVGGTASGDIITTDALQTLTGKTLDADLNTITNIDNNEIKAAAGIEVSKLEALASDKAVITDANGFLNASVVDAAELGFLSGVTSGIQGQLDEKVTGPLSATDEAVALFDGVTGGVIKNSLVTIDVSGNIATPGLVDGRDVSVDGADLDAHIAATSAHGATGNIIGRGDTPALGDTTGTYDDQTVSSIRGVTTPTPVLADDGQFLRYDDATTSYVLDDVPLTGDVTGTNIASTVAAIQNVPVPAPLAANNGQAIVYNDVTGEFEYGSTGTGGGFNLESDPYAQAGVGDWLLYNDASASPVDLTGGTATATFTTLPTSTVILSDAYQGVFQLAKPASNVQGNGVAKLYSIPAGVRAQGNVIVRVRVSPDVAIALGDFKLAAYDVDNARLLPTFGLTDGNIPAADANGQLRLTVRIPVESTTTQIRLGFHVATNNTTAVNLRFSDLSVGVDSVVDVAPVETFNVLIASPTIASSGVEVTNFTNLRFVGKRQRGVYTLGVRFNFNIAAGNNFDRLSVNISSIPFLQGKTLTNAFGSFSTNVNSATDGRGYVFGSINLDGNNLAFDFVGDFVAQTGRVADGTVTIYVQDEDSTALISTTEAVNQNSVLVATKGAVQSIPNNTPTVVTYPTLANQNGGSLSYNTTTGVATVLESGYYYVNACLDFAGSATGIRILDVNINSSSLRRGTPTAGSVSGRCEVDATGFYNAGDTISISAFQNSGGALNTAANPLDQRLSIHRIPDFTTFGVYGNDRPPTIQRFTSGSGTYVKPYDVRYLRVRMVGGGGGGAGSGSSGGTSGGTGGASTFGTSLLTANGGVGSNLAGGGGAGGTVTVNSPAINIASIEGSGGNSGAGSQANAFIPSWSGGSSNLGPGGAGTLANGVPGFLGGGGSGGSNAAVSAIGSRGGGGAGGYIEALILNPSDTYSYAVGIGGTAGTAGTSGQPGGAGGSGIIIVEEYY